MNTAFEHHCLWNTCSKKDINHASAAISYASKEYVNFRYTIKISDTDHKPANYFVKGKKQIHVTRLLFS